MISINKKAKCNGCCACVDICPQNAISLNTDFEGFWYPKINKDRCNYCGLCEKICPELNIKELKKNDYENPVCYAAIHKNIRIRWDSTSGGLFSALAEVMYNEDGYVSGAIYNENFTVRNYVSNKFDDLSRLRSSKYLQSNAQGLYIEIKQLLKNEKKVLACGTPCQMAALRSFLRKNYENLIIVDFICRGVNSPKVYRKYLDSLEKKYKSKVNNVKAKNKEIGWRNLTRKVVFENGQAYYGVRMDDDFRRGYHTNVFCRPSCYVCQFKGFPRMADITLGDFWGIEKVNKNLDNNIGTSLVMLNSKKGEQYFEKIKGDIEYQKVLIESVLPGNIALKTPITKSKINRTSFFNDLNQTSFDEVAKKYFPLTDSKLSFKDRIKHLLKHILFFKRKMGFNPKALYQFFWLNFWRKNTKSNWKNNFFIHTTPHAVFDIHPNAKININKGLIFGEKTVKRSKLESRLRMEANTTLTINDGPLTRYGDSPYILRYGCDIQIINEGKLTIGQGGCNMNLAIMCAKEITIGNWVRMGRDVTIRDWNGPHVILNDSYTNHAPVHIKDHVWITSGVTIMPGVTIGEGSVIGGNSVVTRNIPSRCFVVGSPAKVIKENIEWY